MPSKVQPTPGEPDPSCDGGDDAAADLVWACGVAACCGGIYYATMYRKIAGGDSGDLVSTSCALGVAHPPGYPLHTLLGAVFLRLLPWGTPAWRVNLVSVVAGAMAAAKVMRASLWMLREADSRVLSVEPRAADPHVTRWLAVLGAFSFALSPLVWRYSTHAEVFALNNLLAAWLVELALTFAYKQRALTNLLHLRCRDRRGAEEVKSSSIQARSKALETEARNAAVEAAFVMGLGVSNQHSFVLFALPAAVLALMRSCRVAKATGEGAREAVAEFGPKVWATGRMSLLETHTLARLVVACAAGLSPYLYVIWAARDPPLSSWGETHTLQGFITHFFRREYGTFAVLPVAGGSPTREGVVLAQATMLEYLRAFAANLRAQSPLGWSLCFSAIGWCVCLQASILSRDAKRERLAGWVGVVTSCGVQASVLLVSYLVVFHALCNIPLGSAMHLGVLKRFWMQPQVVTCLFVGPGLRWVLRGLAYFGLWDHRLVGTVVVGLMAWQVGAHYTALDRSRSAYIDLYGRAFLVGMPANSTLLVQGDINVHAIRYLQACEGLRPDILFLDQVLMGFRWFPRQTRRHLLRAGVVLPDKARHGHDYSWQEFLQATVKAGGRPFFECGGWNALEDGVEDVAGWDAHAGVVGLCRRVLRNQWRFDVDAHVEMATAAHAGLDWQPPREDEFEPDEWEHHIKNLVWKQRDAYGADMLMLWHQLQHRRALQAAVHEYRVIAETCDVPSMPASVWKRLGEATSYEAGRLQTDGDADASVEMQVESLEAFKRWLQVADKGDPDFPVISKHVDVARAALGPSVALD